MNELNNTKEGPDRNDEFKDLGRIKLNRKKQKRAYTCSWNLTDLLESLQSQVKQLQETTTRLRKRKTTSVRTKRRGSTRSRKK